jgi:A/G-specific adenine glycosylase
MNLHQVFDISSIFRPSRSEFRRFSPKMNKSGFSKKIIEWYQENKRDLPWRDTKDPYPIWLSEIILQQTRVAQGLPYFKRFIENFPSIHNLAAAKEQDVLRLWQGLGYYTRARNLHRCAKVIVEQHHGNFPDNFIDLQKLPGIGAYTAAAIASFAFLEPVAVVDGNVFRVLSRIFGMEYDIASAEGKDFFSKKANELISREHPDLFNQAIMEFGATHCLPKNPKCEDCVFKKSCVALANESQDTLPIKSKKTKVRKRYFYYLVIEQNKKVLMRKREEKDIWKGLYDFPLVETKRPQKIEIVIRQSGILSRLNRKFEIHTGSPGYRHVLSHQILQAKFIFITFNAKYSKDIDLKKGGVRFYSKAAMHKLPKPILVNRYLLESGIL